MEIPRSILERYLKEVQQSDSSQSSISPFYGIWCGAAKTEAEAQKQAKKIRENGFDAQVFVTTDWSNLNTENGMLSRLVPMGQRKLPLRYSRMCREFVRMRI